MKSLKISIELDEKSKLFIMNFQKQQNNIIRFAYNRIKEGKIREEIEILLKGLNNIDLCDSWLIRSALVKSEILIKSEIEVNKYREKENVKRERRGKKLIPLIENAIFGGKNAFYKRVKNQITNAEWKKERLIPFFSLGEASQRGNRKFHIDIVNNKIIFKPKFGIKLLIDIPQLKRNQLMDLVKIAESARLKEKPFTVELTEDCINISYDEFVSEPIPKIENRVMGIDLNPSFIGVTISDVVDGKKQVPIFATAYEISGLFDKTNKSNYELNCIARKLVRIAKWHQCEKIVLEELSINAKNHKKGKKFNKLVNNNWNRNLVINKIKSFGKEQCIEVMQVNVAYSSTIGNMIYDFFDPISSSLEIARRGCFKYVRGKFYPKMEFIKDQWKEYLTEKTDWKSLHEDVVKSRNIKYRVPLDHNKIKTKGFSSSFRSCINIYNFI